MAYNLAHYSNLGHLKEALEKAHEEVTELATLVVGTLEDMILQADIMVPTSAWSENTESETKNKGYNYTAETTVSGLIENANVNITLSVTSLETATKARLSPSVNITTNTVKFYAKGMPTDTIYGKLDAIQLAE